MRSPKRSSFILRLLPREKRLCFELQNLKTGERQSFKSWAALRRHLERVSRHQGLR